MYATHIAHLVSAWIIQSSLPCLRVPTREKLFRPKQKGLVHGEGTSVGTRGFDSPRPSERADTVAATDYRLSVNASTVKGVRQIGHG